ncbi:MAG: adenylate/guanylate cyclase domain-containing protein [Dehalococcoidia bacterium]
MEPRIQYAKTDDGVQIAYTVFGEGPPLVIPPSLIASHLQFEWSLPGRRAFYERLAERATVVRYDPRGMGMSPHDVIDFTVEAGTRDLEAVLDSLGLDQVALFWRAPAGDLPLAYAVRRPDRVTQLVLSGRLGVTRDTSWFRVTASVLPLLDDEWEVYTNLLSRLNAGWDSPDATPLAALVRASHSNQTFRAAYDVLALHEPLALAPQVRVPTLILHQLGNDASAAAARSLAAAVVGAQMAAIPGEFSLAYPNAAGIAVIHDFITTRAGAGRPLSAPELDTGVFRTILFTDIVAHTAMMERLGDAKGRDVLREHERITRDALRAHGGSEIKTIGDSFMTSFTSAQKAVECAIALQRAFSSQEVCGEQVRIRAGINAGEPITEGDDLFGASVILAARSKESAGEGEIVVTDVVRQLVTGKGFLFAERGSVALRGFEDPVRLYEVRWRDGE